MTPKRNIGATLAALPSDTALAGRGAMGRLLADCWLVGFAKPENVTKFAQSLILPRAKLSSLCRQKVKNGSSKGCRYGFLVRAAAN